MHRRRLLSLCRQEGLLERSPAVHIRRSRLDYKSHATDLDRNEVGTLLVAAGLASASDHALVSLLAINGLRVSEALGADIDALGPERGHRTLTVLRKGGKVVTIPLAREPLAPSTWRSANDSPGRSSLGATASGSTATPPGGSCAAWPARLASTSRWAHMRYDRARVSLDRHATYIVAAFLAGAAR